MNIGRIIDNIEIEVSDENLDYRQGWIDCCDRIFKELYWAFITEWHTPQEQMPDIGDIVLIQEYSDEEDGYGNYHVCEVVVENEVVLFESTDNYSTYHPLEVGKWSYLP